MTDPTGTSSVERLAALFTHTPTDELHPLAALIDARPDHVTQVWAAQLEDDYGCNGVETAGIVTFDQPRNIADVAALRAELDRTTPAPQPPAWDEVRWPTRGDYDAAVAQWRTSHHTEDLEDTDRRRRADELDRYGARLWIEANGWFGRDGAADIVTHCRHWGCRCAASNSHSGHGNPDPDTALSMLWMVSAGGITVAVEADNGTAATHRVTASLNRRIGELEVAAVERRWKAADAEQVLTVPADVVSSMTKPEWLAHQDAVRKATTTLRYSTTPPELNDAMSGSPEIVELRAGSGWDVAGYAEVTDDDR